MISRLNGIVLLLMVLLIIALPGAALSSILTRFTSHPQASTSGNGPRSFPVQQTSAYLAYDEQVGMTFTQDSSSLAFNVSAVDQTGPDGVGPGYLLNGLTNLGYWYQVGLSWMWPSSGGSASGFNMNYEVFDPYGNSIFPAFGGGLDTISVNSGDTVLLSLNFTAGYVLMLAKDWNTSSTAYELYSSEGATFFRGLPDKPFSNHVFSGLMTEEYHSAPYKGTGKPVIYSTSGFGQPSGWIWEGEWNTYTNESVFSDRTSSPVRFSNTGLLQYFSSNGTAEIAGAQEFVTGLSPIKLPSLTTTSSRVSREGQQVPLNITIHDPGSPAIRIKSLTITSDIGVYNVTSVAPSSLNGGNSTFTTMIALPSKVVTGNYSLTILLDWRFYESELGNLIGLQPLQTNVSVFINGTAAPPPSQNPPPTTNPPPSANPTPTTASRLLAALRTYLLPGLLAYAATVILVLALIIRKPRREGLLGPTPIPSTCGACGGQVFSTMLYCPSCGTSLSVSNNQPAPVVQDGSAPPSQPS